MEKHSDFLRDFRGDTVHASTLRLLDELGLGDQFAQMPHREIDTLGMKIQGTQVNIDLSRLPGRHKYIALVPQWDFLELLARAAEAEPSFRLLRSTEVLAPIRSGDKVIGVSYRNAAGETGTLHADLTVACDGRSSTLRAAAGLEPRSFGAPMDVWWFRLPRNPDDPHGLAGVLGTGHACVVIDRGDYYQIAYVIPKGRDGATACPWHRGIPPRSGVTRAVAGRSDRRVDVVRRRQTARRAAQPAAALVSRRDAADRRCGARHVTGRRGRHQPRGRRRRRGRPDPGRAAARGKRPAAGNWPWSRPAGGFRPPWCRAPSASSTPRSSPSPFPLMTAAEPPRAVRTVTKFPALRRLLGYAIAIGPLPEHAPGYARR